MKIGHTFYIYFKTESFNFYPCCLNCNTTLNMFIVGLN